MRDCVVSLNAQISLHGALGRACAEVLGKRSNGLAEVISEPEKVAAITNSGAKGATR